MIAISSGHAKNVQGASGYMNEVVEARRVVDRLGQILSPVKIFHDDTSKTKNDNLKTIITWHNKQSRTLDVSVHFNAFEKTTNPKGTECCYVTQLVLAGKVSEAIAKASGLRDRGAKLRKNLSFLNNTNKPAILIEVCFVDSQADTDLYKANFEAICKAIAETIK